MADLWIIAGLLAAELLIIAGVRLLAFAWILWTAPQWEIDQVIAAEEKRRKMNAIWRSIARGGYDV